MSTEALLDEVARVSHGERTRRMVALGRAVRSGDVAAQATLRELEASPDVHCRSLALAAVYGSRDVRCALRLLDDPSRTLRARADELLALFGSDEELASRIARIPAHRAKRLLFILKRRCAQRVTSGPCAPRLRRRQTQRARSVRFVIALSRCRASTALCR